MRQDRHDVSLRAFWVNALRATVLGACFALWLLSDLGSARLQATVSDLVFVLAPAAASLSCLRAHQRERDAHAAWWWISIGCLVWAGGSVAFATYQLVLDRVAPLPSPADVGYLGYTVPMAIGVLCFPRFRGDVWSRTRSALDCLVIAACLLVISSVLVLEPMLSGDGTPVQRAVGLLYPVLDVVGASVVLARCVVLPATRRTAWVPLAMGLLTLSLTDSVYVVRHVQGGYAPGGLLDVGWFAAFALVGVAATSTATSTTSSTATAGSAATALSTEPAAAAPGQEPASVAHPPGFVRNLFPALAVAGAVVALAVRPGFLDDHDRWWLLLPVGLVVALRTVLVSVDQAMLTRNLASAVDRRTAQMGHREQWWQGIVRNLSDVVIVVARDGSVAYCSPAVGAALGHMPMLATAEEMMSQVHPEDEARVLQVIQPVVLEGTSSHGFVECRVLRSDGSYGWFEVEAVGQLDETALEGAVLTLHDVTERRELTDRLQAQAHHDALTGLPNRIVLMDRIEQALVEQARVEQARVEQAGVEQAGVEPGAGESPGRPFGLLLLDLDDFKVINDQHGHAAGDVVLTVIGQRLSELVDAQDTVARLGGDEFAFLVHGSADDVRTVAERLVQVVQQPVAMGGRRFQVHTSVGAVIASEDGADTAAALLSHADIALYEAKAHHRGGVVLVAGAARQLAARRVALREQVAQPDLDQFSVVYQPVVDLRSGTMRGVEALMRWTHPEHGPVPPDVFIEMAEHGGSIGTLGWFVLDEACRQIAEWNDRVPDQRLAVGVNVSILQLDEPGFATGVADVVRGHGLEPDQVVLEITEQSLAVDFETAVAVVSELRAIGLSVAVDDFGTGYSSLRYLHRFDADVVKVDRSFVAHVVDSVHTQKLVRSVMHMAASLDLQSIAEGIETREQLETVRSLGCELGQGYLFSRPVPPAEIERMLRDPQPLADPVQLQSTA